MSELLTKINGDLKQAMISKDSAKTSALRMLLSAIKNKEISIRQNGAAELGDREIEQVIASEIKKRKDSAEAYHSGNREDLAAKEEAEIYILKNYLPEQLSAKEVEKLAAEVVNFLPEADRKNFGKIMGLLMPKLKGRADGNVASAAVKKILG